MAQVKEGEELPHEVRHESAVRRLEVRLQAVVHLRRLLLKWSGIRENVYIKSSQSPHQKGLIRAEIYDDDDDDDDDDGEHNSTKSDFIQ